MERFRDEPGYKYAFGAVLYRGEQVAVKRPQCGRLSFIYQGDERREARCTACIYHEKEPEAYWYGASGVCEACER